MKPLFNRLLAGQVFFSIVFFVLFLVAQVFWPVTVSVARAQDKPTETARPAPREIIAAVPRSWPPQYSVDENGKPIGFAIDVIEGIAARAGVRVKYRVLDAFADVSEVMQKGGAHIIPNSGITADRSNRYFFTEPVETFVVSIFVRHNTTDIKRLDDLVGRRVAVVEHNISEKLLKHRKDIKSVVHRDAVTALFDLLSGNVDALVFPEPVMLHLARKAGVDDHIKMVGKPLKELKRAIRVQRSEPALFAALNAGVKGFVGTPAYRRIYLKWYGKPQPFWTVKRVAWSMGGGLALILVLMVAWRYQTALRLNRALQVSEKQFKGMFENAGVGVAKTTPDGRFLLANDRFVDIVGHDRDALLSCSFGDITHPEDAKNNLAAIKELLAGHKQNYVTEKRYIRADRSPVWTTLTVVVVRNDDGAPEYLLAVIEDITDRKQAEKALNESEGKFKDFAEAASDWLWEMDENFCFTSFSDRRRDLTSLDPEENIGKTRWEAAGADPDENEYWREHRATLEANEPFRDFEYDFTDSNGRHAFVSVSGKPFFGEDGALQGYRGTATDITENKKTEEVKERLSQAVETVPVGIALFDSDDRLVFFNDRYGELMGVIKDILVPGVTFEEVIRTIVERQPVKDALSRKEEFIRERIKHHRNPTGPFDIRRDNLWLLANETRLPDGSIFTIISDVTEHRQAEEDRRLALIDSEQANQAKSEFLATMSHELRTPLNAILGFSDILSQQYFGPPGEGKYREYAADIHTSGEHLLELVNDLLDISTIEAGKQSLNKELLAVNEMIAESFNALGQKAQEKGIKLATEVSKNLPPLYADRRAFRQIFLNLLSNAVKFTPDGGKITVSAKATQQQTTFKITDTGGGISAEMLPKLTEPFTRGTQDPHKTVDGWGLGLAITKSLIDLHDGEMDIKSTVGKGTTVTVILPNDTA